MSELLFYVFGALAVAGALGMVLNVRNTVAGAMSLVLSMVSLGGVYVLLEAYLIGVLQILVYAGAIVVLFLFVVMLLNLRAEQFSPERQRARQGARRRRGRSAGAPDPLADPGARPRPRSSPRASAATATSAWRSSPIGCSPSSRPPCCSSRR